MQLCAKAEDEFRNQVLPALNAMPGNTTPILQEIKKEQNIL
jgi:hypothetical protein